MVLVAPSSPASTDSDAESGRKKLMLELKLKVKSRLIDKIKRKAMRSHLGRQGLMLELKLKVKSRLNEKIRRKAMRVLSLSHLGVDTICFDRKEGTFTLVGHINPVEVVFELRKICVIDIVSVAILTARNDTFPTTARITELQPVEDTDLGRKRSLGILLSGEQLEQSEKQQEDQPPPRQADSFISQVKGSPLSHPLPSLSLPLASEARPSSSPVSHPSQGTSDQTQAAPDEAPGLSFPCAPSPLRIFRMESLLDMPAQSSISRGACLPKVMNLMEEKGLGGHDQLFDSAILHLLSGIAELKRHYDLHAGEMASRLKEADDIAIVLRKQVEELEAKLLMANMPERRLMDMVCTSEERHARTNIELALMREKMDEVNRRIEYLEKEKAEEKACRASIEGETMSAPRPSPAAPRSTSLSFVPSPSPRLTDSEVCKESALFPELTSYLDSLKMRG